MPRLTHTEYYQAHLLLRRFWLNRHSIFGQLSASQQWQLHDYFQPGHDITKSELLLHRVNISRQRPQLPQQAGKSYAKFVRTAAAWSAQLVTSGGYPTPSAHRGARYLRVRSVVRPEIDTQALARSIIEMAKTDLAARLATKRQEEAEDEAGE